MLLTDQLSASLSPASTVVSAAPSPGGFVVVNFHYVRPTFDHPYAGIHGCTPEMLASQLDALGQVGEFVGLSDVLAAATGGRSLPTRAVLITFDDGLREQVEHALPVLDRRGVPAAYFVNTAPLLERRVLPVHRLHLLRAHVAPTRLATLLAEAATASGLSLDVALDTAEVMRQYRYDEPEVARLKFLLNFVLPTPARDRLVDSCFRSVITTEDAPLAESLYADAGQLRELAGRGWLGSHGHAHLALGTLSAAAARADLVRSRQWIERWTGFAPRAVSYPFGSPAACGAPVARLAAAAGYTVGFTMQRAVNAGLRDRWQLARFDSNDVPGGRFSTSGAAHFLATSPRAGGLIS